MITTTATTRVLALLLAALLLTACNTRTVRTTRPQPVLPAAASIPQALLPDVNIAIFDAGIDELDPRTTTTTPGVRRAEAHYVPQRLRDTLERSGQWGQVRVVPTPERLVDVMVSGKILESDGRTLEVSVTVGDSRGEHWFTRRYDETISIYAYDMEIRRSAQPFQNLYNRIANDMAEYLTRQDLTALEAIRATTEMRFAARFAPAAYGDYVVEQGSGSNRRYRLQRLPAETDPLLQRIRNIRVRDDMFIDHLQAAYDDFDRSMATPYDAWREESYREAEAEAELKSQSTARLLGGALAIIGGILAQGSGSSTVNSAGVVAIGGGALAVKSGLDKRAEARIHTDAMKELSDSLNAEIQPQTIALTDRTVELSGTVDEQYAQWQDLLQQIYQLETGQGTTVPADTNNY